MSDNLCGWECECGNVLGVMHRDGHRVMVLDQFRGVVAQDDLAGFLEIAGQKDYCNRDLVRGDVICAACGRANPWDASEQLFKRLMHNRSERTYGLEVDHGV